MAHKILIATPQADFGELVRLNIEEGGDYEATLVKTGKEVMETANTVKFDLIVLDASLTDKPFVPLAQNLMDENPDLKIIVIPPNNDPKDPSLEEIIYHGVLSRPFYPPDLVEMVNEILISPKSGKPKAEPEKSAVDEKPVEEVPIPEETPVIEEVLDEENTPLTNETMDLESIANILTEAANPPQIVSEVANSTPDGSNANKDSVIGPINEEDFAKEVEALFAQEGIKNQNKDSTPAIIPPKTIENPVIPTVIEEQPVIDEPVYQEQEVEKAPEEDTEALALRLAAQIRAQTESSDENNDLLQEAENLFLEPEKPETPSVNNYLDMTAPSGNSILPVKQDTGELITDKDANETYEDLAQDDDALAKRHSDMAEQYNALATEYLALAREHSDLAKFHNDLSEEKSKLTQEKEAMLKRKVELVSEIYQTQQSLKRIITQTTATGAMILKSGDLVAQVGNLTSEGYTEISAVLNNFWDEDKKSDLIRFMHLQSDSSDYLLYASSIRDDFTLGLIYEISTPISVMRSQSSRISHILADEPLIEMLKLPVKDLEVLSENQPKNESNEWVPEATVITEPDVNQISPDEVFRNVLAQLKDQVVSNPDQTNNLFEEGLKFESVDGVIVTVDHPEDDFSGRKPDSPSLPVSQSSAKQTQAQVIDLDAKEILHSVNNQIASQFVEAEEDVTEKDLFGDLLDELEAANEFQSTSVTSPIKLSPSKDQGKESKNFQTNDYDLDDLYFPWEEDDQYTDIFQTGKIYPAASTGVAANVMAPKFVKTQNKHEKINQASSQEKQELKKENDAVYIEQKPEMASTEKKSKSNFLMTSHIFTCLLAPRFKNIELTPEMRNMLSEQMTEISTIFGWKLINLVIEPLYIGWSFEVLPSISKESMLRVIRHRTSKLLITHFSQFSDLIEGGDFWASDVLSNNKAELPEKSSIAQFLDQVRQKQ